jgi:hypothetical protein
VVWHGTDGYIMLSYELRLMKEWDAPESNKTEVGVELTRNIPSTTLGFS